MDDIIEFIIELVLEIGAEAAGSSKVPKWIRYPLIAFFGLIYAVLTVGLLVGGVLLMGESVPFAVLLLALGLVILFAGCHKLRKEYLNRKDQSIEPFA